MLLKPELFANPSAGSGSACPGCPPGCKVGLAMQVPLHSDISSGLREGVSCSLCQCKICCCFSARSPPWVSFKDYKRSRFLFISALLVGSAVFRAVFGELMLCLAAGWALHSL